MKKFLEKIILASASPRRAELLSSVGIPFRAIPANINESAYQGSNAKEKVMHLAEAKARFIACDFPEEHYIFAADTLVELDGMVFGKPKDIDEARMMIASLSGKTHQVFTAICGINCKTGTVQTSSCSTNVTFKALTEQEIDMYISFNEWKDAAGAYKIQEKAAFFIKSIEGSYSNVVGLPLNVFYDILYKLDYPFTVEK